MKKILGRHFLLDLYECDVDTLNNKEKIKDGLIASAKIAHATIVNEVFHQFNPHGISGVVVIAESHIAIHTWPEYGIASIDIFTCSDKMKAEAAIDYLKSFFRAKDSRLQLVERGVVDTPDLKTGA